jgi:hypothetical protein
MDSSPTSPLDPDPAKSYYVIIGCGFSGVLNHALLRPTRLGGLPILHIGETDPWRNYHPMPMGQPPTLLTLPGFTKRPSKLDRYTNLKSDEFARINKFEWNQLAKNHTFYHEKGRVVGVGKPGPRYEVKLASGHIYQAEYIDVCGGPGPARRPSPDDIDIDKVLLREFDGATKAGHWPRLVSGEAFLSSRTPAVPAEPGSSVCVYGGGPTGAWCVEHAQKLGHRVYWVANKNLNEAFVADRRNDHLLRDSVVREIVGGNHVVTGRLVPADSSTTFGENLQATKITATAPDEVKISFTASAPTTWRFTESTGPRRISPPTVESLDVQQVVLSIGQETSYKEDRSWASLLKPVLEDAISGRTYLITDRQRRVVGLQSDDERVRLLGAAALGHPKVRAEWEKPGSPSYLFFRSLVEQARVPIGITLSATLLAEANEFWSSAPNENLNTCGLVDLWQLIHRWGWPAELDTAETWLQMRGNRIPPFARSELRDLAAGKVSY